MPGRNRSNARFIARRVKRLPIQTLPLRTIQIHTMKRHNRTNTIHKLITTNRNRKLRRFCIAETSLGGTPESAAPSELLLLIPGLWPNWALRCYRRFRFRFQSWASEQRECRRTARYADC